MKLITPTEIMACDLIVWASAILIGTVWAYRELKSRQMPTNQETNDLTNKLNRIALDRANRKDTK